MKLKNMILMGLTVLLVFFLGFLFGRADFGSDSNDDVALRMQSFIRDNMFDADRAVVVDVVDKGSLYLLVVDFDGTSEFMLDAFASKDGQFFIPMAYDVDEVLDLGVDVEAVEIDLDAELSNIEFSEDSIDVLYFWGDGCGFCELMDDFLTDFQTKYPDVINVIKFETWYDATNAALLGDVSQIYDDSTNAVPKVFIGDRVFIGASEQIFDDIQDYVFSCLGTEECDLLL